MELPARNGREGTSSRSSRAERLPVVGEVPVQVHAVGIAAGVGGDAVWVEVRDHLQVGLGGDITACRGVGDGDSCRLVAVDGTQE